MAATERMTAFLIVLLALAVTQTSTEEAEVPSDSDTSATTYILSPAEELLEAAKKAGYNLTLDRFDQAAAATDEEVEEMMPAPVAQAFIGHRRRDNVDLIREQMIGMIFTGSPQGSRPRRPPPQRSRPNFRPNPTGRLNVQYNPQGEGSIQHTRKVPAPENILKPLPFMPGPTMVKFPSHPKPPSRHPTRQSAGPRPRPRPSSTIDDFHPVGDNFGNTVGPDFGPVTFTDFNSQGNFGFNNNFDTDFESPNVRPPPSNPRPSRPAPRPFPARPSPSRPSPSRPSPSRPSSSRPSPSRPSPSRPSPPRHPQGRPTGGFDGGCLKYTEDICLDTAEYPHEAILTSLIRDPSRSDNMMAEVRSQSADNLVDGLSASQESKYDYQHYFGNRRAGTENHAHRDFARDGGYLCPSEVKYARPKRARNSKGRWKYIVNMDKYSQTIRMEKCMKPGGACSYVSHHYRATCSQIYNYHRLLSWEDGRGLHMDIFKVPSCCSCHIQGYAYVFPPLNNRRQHTSGSVQIDQTVRAPPSDTNAVAPGSDYPEEAYSPASFPNVSTKTILRRRPATSRPGIRRPGSRPNSGYRNVTSINRNDELLEYESVGGVPSRGVPVTPLDRSGFSAIPGSVNRRRRPSSSGDDDSRVNYGYHPIIDFFSPYGSQKR